MTLTKFPNGIQTSHLISAETVKSTGKIFYVSNSTVVRPNGVVGADVAGLGKDPTRPFATIDFAVGQCVANRGDTIFVMEGHAETVSAAGGIALDVAGVSVIGMGVGDARPTLTFSATAATVAQSANNTKFLNFILVPSVDSVVSPLAVTGDGCEFDIVLKDASDAVECVRAVLATGADRLKGKLEYHGRTGGDACVNGIRLVGCAGVDLDVNLYGKASTAWVEFLTTACTDVIVNGYMYNSGTTNASKNVIDTATGSTWWSTINDGTAGASYSGGSGAALASDDVSAVASALLVPTADVTTNTNERDVIGNKTDASVYVPGTTKSIAAYVKGHADLQERVAVSATAVMVNGNTIFTIAGGPIQILALVSECVTANDGTASTVQYNVTPTTGSAQTISAASASIANAAAGASITLAGTALSTAALYNANGPNLIANPGTIYAPAGTITVVVGVGSTTGTWRHRIRYKPLAVGVTVS